MCQIYSLFYLGMRLFCRASAQRLVRAPISSSLAIIFKAELSHVHFDNTFGDGSNYWGPNPACVEAMLREVGFPRVERIEPSYMQSRMVFHAFK
jgi:hypothetical protein